jgi:Family of unknown function (DUF6459)
MIITPPTLTPPLVDCKEKTMSSMSSVSSVIQLRRLPVPQCEPPYDDESDTSPPYRVRAKDGIQGTLALAFDLPNGLPAEPEAPPDLRLVPSLDARPANRRSDRNGEARAWAGQLARAVVEVLAGERPATQLLRWTTDEVYHVVARRARRAGRSGELAVAGNPKPKLRSVRACEPAEGVVEASAVVGRGDRFSAVALRLELVEGRWRCTALEMSWPPGDGLSAGQPK